MGDPANIGGNKKSRRQHGVLGPDAYFTLLQTPAWLGRWAPVKRKEAEGRRLA
jgi:hypothetical protein